MTEATQSHTPSRRTLLACFPLAAAAAIPVTMKVARSPDANLLAACDRYFALDRHFASYGDEDIDENDPALPEWPNVIDKIAVLPAVSLEGHIARARVAMNLAPGAFGSLTRHENGALLQALLRDLTTGDGA